MNLRYIYAVFGWLDKQHYEQIGTFETFLSVHDCFDMVVQAFDNGNYPEGLFMRRIK